MDFLEILFIVFILQDENNQNKPEYKNLNDNFDFINLIKKPILYAGQKSAELITLKVKYDLRNDFQQYASKIDEEYDKMPWYNILDRLSNRYSKFRLQEAIKVTDKSLESIDKFSKKIKYCTKNK